MTRIETGAITLHRDWESLSELVAAVLLRLTERLAAHRVIIELPDDLPLVRVDATLIEQVLEQPPRELRKAHAAGHDGEGATPNVTRLRSSSRSKTMATVFRIVIWSSFSRSFIMGRSKAREPTSALDSLSVARSFVCMEGGRGRTGCPAAGRHSDSRFRWSRRPLSRPSPRRIDPWPSHAPRFWSSRTSPRSGDSCVRPFGAEDYRVVESSTGRRASIEARTHKPELAILDLALPDLDGIEVIRRIRQWSPMPIIVLSARVQERSKIEALDAGANDYVTKPFGVGELLARVRAALRHTVRTPAGTSILRFGNSIVDLEKRTASHDGIEVRLTPIEYRLLTALAKDLGMVVTHRQLLTDGLGADPRSGYPLSARLHEAVARKARDRSHEAPAFADRNGDRVPVDRR